MHVETDQSRPLELLTAVADREQAVWAPDSGTRTIELRNQAVRAAMDAGWTAVEIAQATNVRPQDVDHWVASSRR